MGIFRWHVVMIFISPILALKSHAIDLTELELVNKITETPAYQAQQMINEGDLAQSEKTRAQFQPQLEGQVNYGESKEDPLFQFSPVITVSRSSTLGVAQKLPIGVNAKIEGFSEQLNIPAFNVLRANRTGARLKFEMDLLSNFLGRRDGSEFKNSKIKIKVSELKSVTTKNSISHEMRKLYWSYMGIEESHKMADVLLASAQKQLQEIKARRNSGAADVSDVARAEAQVSGRKTQLSVIEYQKAQLFQQLKSQYDNITTIGFVPTTSAIQDLSDCLGAIKKSQEYLEKSDYTEMINLLKEEKRNSLVQAKTTGDWDLKLQGVYQQNAVAAGYSDSRELFFDQPKDAFQVGLQLTVPLGSARSKAEKHAVLQTQMGYDSKIREIEKLLHTQHERALKSLSLLEAAVSTQDMSVKSLRTSVDSAKRKYSQARISQIEYILEQDKLFSTEVDTIQSRLLIINEVLDYLKVFNKQQCKFNKVIGA